MKPIRRRFFDLATRQIHYRETAGLGPPLASLHHLPGSARQIEPVFAALLGRTVIAPDLAKRAE